MTLLAAISANSANRQAAIGEAHHIAPAHAGIGGVPDGGPHLEFCQSLKEVGTAHRTHRERAPVYWWGSAFQEHHARESRRPVLPVSAHIAHACPRTCRVRCGQYRAHAMRGSNG